MEKKDDKLENIHPGSNYNATFRVIQSQREFKSKSSCLYRLAAPPLGVPTMLRILVSESVVQYGVVKLVSYDSMRFGVKARNKRIVIWERDGLVMIHRRRVNKGSLVHAQKEKEKEE